MLAEQVIPIDFGQGLDKKSDPKAVVAGKFLRLENGVFTSPKRISKRNGYNALSAAIAPSGTLTAPKMTHSYNQELIAADQNLLLTYSPSQSAWINPVHAGTYVSTEITRSTIDQAHPASGCVDTAILGNYALYCWSTGNQTSSVFPTENSQVYASVVDTQSGAILAGPTILSINSTDSAINPVRCCLLGSTVLAVFYIKANAAAIVCRTVTFSGSGIVTFSAENVISTNLSSNFLNFDIINTPTGAAVGYFSATGVSVATINTGGVQAANANIVDSLANPSISVSITPTNNNIWLYWCDSGNSFAAPSSNDVIYAIFSPTLTPVLGATTALIIPSPYYVTNLMTVSTSATTQTLYFGKYIAAASSGNRFTDITSSVTLNSTGTIGSTLLFANGIMPYSKSITIGSDNWAVFIYRGTNLFVDTNLANHQRQQQPTYFLVRLSTSPAVGAPYVAGRFGYGLGNSQNALQTIPNYSPNLSALSATKFLFGCSIELQEFKADSLGFTDGFFGGILGAFAYQIDFASANAYRATNAGQLAVLNGGLTQIYDGQTCTEFGFHLFPEITVLHQGTGGDMDDGVYSYIAIFQWNDAQGNQHQSAPSEALAITVTSGSGSASVTVCVSDAYLSQKLGLSVAIFRTEASGTIYYQVNDPFFENIATGAVFSSFKDGLVDADIVGNPQAYAYPGSPVLENGTPPPSMIMLAHNNRLQFVDSENPNTYWYTKSFQPLIGLSPTPFMTNQIDPKLGNIAALAEMDSNLVILKQNGMCIISGDGVDDTGSNSTLSFPQFIPSDVGCDQLKSVVGFPGGVIFHSANGIYLLSRSLGVSYIGAEVENVFTPANSEIITAATLVPGKSQIRFLCSGGLTIVFDYIFNQWSTFTNHTGTSATVWNGTYVYATSGGSIYQESSGVYNDNGIAFSLLAQTSWLALAGIQGFQRVKRLIMLGDFINGNSASHALSISAAYDFSTTFQAAISYLFGATSASGVFQYRERLPIQKCDTISLLIQETTTGSSAEYIDLTNISFEAGIKRGVSKLGGLQSVG